MFFEGLAPSAPLRYNKCYKNHGKRSCEDGDMGAVSRQAGHRLCRL